MPRSPITQVLEMFNMLTIDEQAIFLDLADPQPDEEEAPAKKPKRKRSSKSAGRSARAASLGTQMSKALKLPVGNNIGEDGGDGLCVVGVDSKGETCGEPADANVHHLSTHPDYHEFKSWQVTASTNAARACAGE
jgi:hypothetical protein